MAIMSSDQEHFLSIRDAYFNSLCVELLTHGMYTVVATIALYSLSQQTRRQFGAFTHVTMAFLILSMYALATIHVAVRWYWIRESIIVNGSTAALAVASLGDERFVWLWLTSGIVASLNILTADCILIWRCWTVWDRNWKVAVLPILCTIGGIIFTGFFIYQEQPHPSAQWSSWGASINWGIEYFTMSLVTTLLCTTLIVYRIWQIGQVDALRTYHRVIEIIVESAALYAIALIVFLAFFVRDDLNTGYPQAVLYSITGIAPTLIVVRVASGPRDYYRSTVPSTSLRFGSNTTREEIVEAPTNTTESTSFRTQSSGIEEKVAQVQPVYLPQC